MSFRNLWIFHHQWNHFKLLSIWVRGHLKHSGRLIKGNVPEVITFFQALFKPGKFLMRQNWFAVISEGGETRRPFFTVTLLFGVPYFMFSQCQGTANAPFLGSTIHQVNFGKHFCSLLPPPKLFWFSSNFPWQFSDICTDFITRNHKAEEKKRMLKKSYYEQLEI